jgi:hypothetical protein
MGSLDDAPRTEDRERDKSWKLQVVGRTPRARNQDGVLSFVYCSSSSGAARKSLIMWSNLRFFLQSSGKNSWETLA